MTERDGGGRSRPPRLRAPTHAERAKAKLDERDRRIVEIWRERPRGRRTADDVLPFFGWLSEHQPDLVPSGAGAMAQVRRVIEPHLEES